MKYEDRGVEQLLSPIPVQQQQQDPVAFAKSWVPGWRQEVEEEVKMGGSPWRLASPQLLTTQLLPLLVVLSPAPLEGNRL